MSRKTKVEENQRDILVGKSYTYLNSSFHKFKEPRKSQIALEIVKADMKRKQEHTGKFEVEILNNIPRPEKQKK